MPIDPNNPLTDSPPLDIASMLQSLPQQQAPAAPPSGDGKGNKKGWMLNAALAALMPIAAKRGGPLAMAGMLRGIQRAQAEEQQQAQQQFQNDRLTRQDQRADETLQANEHYRQQTLAGGILKEATGALQGAESQDAIAPLLDLYRSRLTQAGFRDTGMLDRYAQSLPPTRFEQKAAEKYIGQLEKTYGQDWAQKVGTATFKPKGVTLPVGPDGQERGLTVQELLGKVGTNIEGLPVKPANERPKPQVGSFEDYLTRTYGEAPTPQQILDARKTFNQADDKGTDPTVQALRELTLQQKQQATQSAGGLNARQTQQVNAQARSYDTNQVVKNTQTMSEAVSFANGLDPNTKNPADDQALIYAFAKAMDPNSVVREGEYATVQRYAQSWAESFGFNAARIFSNTAFLTPQARANMKRTIQARFRAAQGQYKVVRDSYVKKINKITGMNDGEDWLTDYGGAFPVDPDTAPPANTRATVTPPTTAAPSPAPAGAVPNPFRRN